jgi:hypothetical protein
MRRADDPGLPVGEQHRRAIGRKHAERNPRYGGHHAVGARVGRARPRPLDGDGMRAVDLVAGAQLFDGEGELCRRDRAVLLDAGRISADRQGAH